MVVQEGLEYHIVAKLQDALIKAQHGEWDAAGDIVDGLWSAFMALEKERGLSYDTIALS